MATTVRMTMVLTGPREGFTENINGHQFIDGTCVIIGQDDLLGPCMRLLSTYGAYPEGSGEHRDAVAKYKQLIGETEDGLNKTEEGSEPGKTEQVSSDIQPEGEGSPKEEAAELKANEDSKEGNSGVHSSGTGHEDSGISSEQKSESGESDTAQTQVVGALEVNSKLLKAVMSLDAEDDNHWVKSGKNAGKPKITVIEEAYGQTGITRNDVEEVAPGYDKDRALEIAIANL